MKIHSGFNSSYVYFWMIGLALAGASCSSSKNISPGRPSLDLLVGQSTVFSNHFTGFVLFDPVKQQNIYSLNGDKYFTPASNTKILTLYTALMSLPDTLPSVRMAEQGDSLIIKGMGDPTLFNELWPDHPVSKLLCRTDKKIFLVQDVLQDDIQGAGWAWDDYQDDYQAEKSALPLYGNLVRFTWMPGGPNCRVYPSFFQSKWSFKENKNTDRAVSRAMVSNTFDLNSSFKGSYYLPFKTDMQVIRDLLQDTLRKEVHLIQFSSINPGLTWTILPGVPADSVYAQMMKVSDNFIAEQLLLLTDAYIKDSCNTQHCINFIKEKLFRDVPDTLQWYDGSGLSRYNLITPRTLIAVLNKVMTRLGMNGVKRIFATGGVGTLAHWYKGESPYLYAKTGSLMNNHSLSGFIHTLKGHDLIFSFMHSNYTGSVNPIRMEMQKTLEFIRDTY